MAGDTDKAVWISLGPCFGLRRGRIGPLGILAQGYQFSAPLLGQVFVPFIRHLVLVFNPNWNFVLVEQVVGFSSYSGLGTRALGGCRTSDKENRKR
jgi:hypothetical protein